MNTNISLSQNDTVSDIPAVHQHEKNMQSSFVGGDLPVKGDGSKKKKSKKKKTKAKHSLKKTKKRRGSGKNFQEEEDGKDHSSSFNLNDVKMQEKENLPEKPIQETVETKTNSMECDVVLSGNFPGGNDSPQEEEEKEKDMMDIWKDPALGEEDNGIIVYDKKSERQHTKILEDTRELARRLEQMADLIKETKASIVDVTSNVNNCVEQCNSFEKDLKFAQNIAIQPFSEMEFQIGIPDDGPSYGIPEVDETMLDKESKMRHVKLTEETHELAQRLDDMHYLVKEAKGNIFYVTMKTNNCNRQCDSFERDLQSTKEIAPSTSSALVGPASQYLPSRQSLLQDKVDHAKEDEARSLTLAENTRKVSDTLEQMKHIIEETETSINQATLNGKTHMARCNHFEENLKSTEGFVQRALSAEQLNDVMKLEKEKFRVETIGRDSLTARSSLKSTSRVATMGKDSLTTRSSSGEDLKSTSNVATMGRDSLISRSSSGGGLKSTSAMGQRSPQHKALNPLNKDTKTTSKEVTKKMKKKIGERDRKSVV